MPPRYNNDSNRPTGESRATLAAEVRALREELRQVKRGAPPAPPPPLRPLRESIEHPLSSTPWWRRSRERHDCSWPLRDDSVSPERVSDAPIRTSEEVLATPVLIATPKSLGGTVPSERAAPASSPVARLNSRLPSTTLPRLMPTEWGEMRGVARRSVYVAADVSRYQSPDRSRGAAVLEWRLKELDEEVRALRLENASLRAELEVLRRCTSPARGHQEGDNNPRPPSRGRSASRTRRHQCVSPRLRSRTPPPPPEGHTQTSWLRFQCAQRAKAKRRAGAARS